MDRIDLKLRPNVGLTNFNVVQLIQFKKQIQNCAYPEKYKSIIDKSVPKKEIKTSIKKIEINISSLNLPTILLMCPTLPHRFHCINTKIVTYKHFNNNNLENTGFLDLQTNSRMMKSKDVNDVNFGKFIKENVDSLKAKADKSGKKFNCTIKLIYEDIKKYVIVMVGLPARGKSYISYRLSRHLNWIGINTKIFNLGTYRRNHVKIKDSSFFDNSNPEYVKIRHNMLITALKDVTEYLNNLNGEIAIVDATNTTRERREFIVDSMKKNVSNINIMMLESICNSTSIINENIVQVKLNSPDYVTQNCSQDVITDFQSRIRHYEQVYEPLDAKYDEDETFICIYDQGKRFLFNSIYDIIPTRISYFLMNLRVIPQKTIYITRHGESEMNLAGRIGGDSKLSVNGTKYSQELSEFFQRMEQEKSLDQRGKSKMKVWSSTLKRSTETANHLENMEIKYLRELNELDAGICETMTYEEIKDKFPNVAKDRAKNKYSFRYPNGESYEDLVQRLEPVIMKLMHEENVLVICHQAIARCLLAYFNNQPLNEMPHIDIPLHCVIKLVPHSYGCHVEFIKFNVTSVNTYYKAVAS
ncbi:hypothetical protein A3Q56_04345 [Intoshia linei]|uniref:6-phosphofructo-2-kinase domain-containing protein n=1 Tax=Intoshia linei TaxID=1819745 RepID=A0A177B121_9BILA|nr:hypothetical protein A3Q56_04345 [Intoshia linei]